MRFPFLDDECQTPGIDRRRVDAEAHCFLKKLPRRHRGVVRPAGRGRVGPGLGVPGKEASEEVPAGHG